MIVTRVVVGNIDWLKCCEISEHDPVACRAEDILWFDISMHNVEIMTYLKTFENLEGEPMSFRKGLVEMRS